MIRARKQGGMLMSDKGSYGRFVLREALLEGMMWELSEWSEGQLGTVFQAEAETCLSPRKVASLVHWWNREETGLMRVQWTRRESGARWTQGGGQGPPSVGQRIWYRGRIYLFNFIITYWLLYFCPVQLKIFAFLQHRIINNTAIKTFVLHNPHT